MPISLGLSPCHDVDMVRRLTEARSAIADLVGRPVEAAEFSREIGAALRQTVTFDGWCMFGLDPSSGLRTAQFGGRGTEHTVEMARNEAFMSDVNKYCDLAVAAVPAGWLSRDHPEGARSFRLQEILMPQGFHSEIRLALRQHGRLWGALVLFREDPRRLFDDHDVAALCVTAGPLSEAIRAYPVRPLPRRGFAPGPGVVAVAPDNRVVAISQHAQEWLDDLVPGGDDETYPSDVTRVLFDAAHRLRRGDVGGTSACVRTISGHWLHVEATALSIGEADVAVILQPATVQQLLGALVIYHRLTARESTVLELLSHGLAGKHIARAIGLSPQTVNGHLQSIYRKCRVTGREELFGRLR
jgi:DNA-binding NarL/FixJ family response regulator